MSPINLNSIGLPGWKVVRDRMQMADLRTGYLDYEQLGAEVVNVADDLLGFGIETVYVSFGFGCERGKAVQWEEVPVPTRGLVQFITDSEADGTFALREADLQICVPGVEFLLCHERDVHCSGAEGALLRAVRRRWSRDYEHSHERRSGGQWHRLAGRPKDSRDA